MEISQYGEYGIDYNEGMNRFMNKEDLFIKFLFKFRGDQSYNQLKEAIDNDDNDAAFKAAHTLKGVAANLSMTVLAKAASDVTEEFRTGNGEVGKSLMPNVDEGYSKVITFLEMLEN